MHEDGLENKSKLWPTLFLDKDLDDAELHLSEFRVYLHLWRRADKEHVAWPGVDSISQTVRANKKTVISAIKELESRGFIEVKRLNGARSNYEILPKHCWIPLPKTDRSVTRNGIGALPKTDRSGVKEVTVPLPKTDEPVQNRERKYSNPSISNKENPEDQEPDLDKIFGKKPNPDKSRAKNQGEVEEFCHSIGLTRRDGEFFWIKWTENGWKNGSQKIRDWRLTIRKWKTAGWCPSQKATTKQAITREPPSLLR